MATDAQLTDLQGRTIRTVQFNGRTTVETRGLPAGSYMIRIETGGKTVTRKFVVGR